jgi:hypothetical protein
MTEQGERVRALEIKIEHLEDRIEDMAKTMNEVRDLMAQGKGAWWVLMAAAGLAGFIASKAASWLPTALR